VDLVSFGRTLANGIGALKAAGIEVVLIDPQYYPRSAGVPRYEDFITVMRRVARELGVPVFRRYAIMRYLISSGQHTVDDLLWKDKFHLNDVSYGCLAELMAQAVEAEIRRPAAQQVITAGVATARPFAGFSPPTAY
jgi:lysophospholipase L1-like esterase